MGDAARDRWARAAGFTILEILIYSVVAAILSVPIGMIVVGMSRASAEGDMMSKVLERNRSSLQRIDAEYRKSMKGTTAILNGGKALQFTSAGAFNGVGPAVGPVIRYEIRLAPGEALNGRDDNGNGLIDEGSLFRVDVTNNKEVLLTNCLNAGTSSFAAAGTGVTVTLVTSGRTHRAPNETDVTRTLTIYPRN